MSYSYNLAGEMISQIYPSGRVVASEYDESGRVAGIRNPATGTYYVGAAATDTANRIQYAAHGNVSKVRLGNGLWEHTNFNSRLQPEQIGLGTASTNSSVIQLDYSYGTTNNNGNVQNQTMTLPGGLTLTQNFSYDQLNRLQSAQELNGATQIWKQGFIYADQSGQNSRYGNRRIDADNTTASLITENPVFDSTTNRIAPQAGEQYNYDAAGNMTKDRAGHLFTFDADNRQTSYNGGNPLTGGATYAYDSQGRRVKKVSSAGTTTFIYNVLGQLVAEYGDTQSNSRGTTYLTEDALGSPRVMTNSDGVVIGRHDYLPFGEEIPASFGGRAGVTGYAATDTVKQKFTQKERDTETGLDYFGARYFASNLGRFASADPALTSGSVFNPQSWNRYAYGFNNPLKYVDPTGAWVWSTALGGALTDEELLKNAGTDKKALAAAHKIIDRRNQFRNAIAAARAAGARSDEPGTVNRALDSYGTEYANNGVTVTWGTTDPGIPANAAPGPNGGLDVDVNAGIVTATVVVTISDAIKLDANSLAQAVAHEGQHVADRQSFANYLNKQIKAAGGLANFVGTPLEAAAYNSPYNRTVQTTEFNAYIVSGLVAQGRDAISQDFANSSFDGHEVWNRSWNAAERPGLRAVGAFEHVTTSPTYMHKLQQRLFSP
jgi:RHS repeat-associated protein